MNQFKPRVYVSVEITPGERRCKAIELDEQIMYDTLEPLDYPSPDADGFARMTCSSTVTIKRVMQSRERVAKMISTAITNALLDMMGEKDTEMGYKKC